MWFQIVNQVLQKVSHFYVKWSIVVWIAIWGLTCGTEKSLQQFCIILQLAVMISIFFWESMYIQLGGSVAKVWLGSVLLQFQ